jgi:hypothetical protein
MSESLVLQLKIMQYRAYIDNKKRIFNKLRGVEYYMF